MLFKPIRPLPYLGTILFFLSGLYLPAAVAQKEQSHPMERLLAKTVALPSEDVKVIAKHLKFPVGYKTPQHTHSGPGPRYVIRGTVEVKEGGKTRTYHAGEAFWESGIPMTAENTGQEEVEIIAVELVPVAETGSSGYNDAK